MLERTHGTLARANKGAIAPAPALLDGKMAAVANTVKNWPGVVATAHWDLDDSSRIDGIDFYVGEDELGHIHLDGSIHLATNPALGRSLVAAGLARPFAYAHGWVEQDIERVGVRAAVALFRRNYARFAGE